MKNFGPLKAGTSTGRGRTITIAGESIPATYEEIPLTEVRLSPKNPRLHQLLRKNPKPTPKEIQEFLLAESGVPDLLRQIRDNRGLIEPIITTEDYEVLEGNCRTAIYLRLNQARANDPSWQTIPAHVLSASVTKKQVLILQAIYHVHSNKIRWGAYEQQAHLHMMQVELEMSAADIATSLGLSSKQVGTLLDAYAAMTKHYLKDSKPEEERRVWSYFLELYKNPKLEEYRADEKHLKEFAKLLKENKLKKGADVRKLPDIVGNSRALQTLKNNGLASALAEVGKRSPSKVLPLFKQMKKLTTLLNAMTPASLEELKTQRAEQREFRELYQAMLKVSKASKLNLR